ncbi:MAG TPA: polysaccharide deacetylase family protein [Verrucomicrobiales bacterium]|nr:polysaccharide deacetylase family protein [Verrucomicrobiales bacterium]
MNYSRKQYVDSQATLIAGRKITLPDDVSNRVFHELTRAEEVQSGLVDQWGNWEWTFSRAQREGKIYRPWLDEELQSIALGIPEIPRWPQGKKWALCLTHDVDLVSQWDTGLKAWRRVRNELAKPRNVVRLANTSARAVVRTLQTPLRRGDDPLWCYERWMEAESAFGFRSSFLFSPSRTARRHPYDTYFRHDDRVKFDGNYISVRGMISAMATRGWDVGIHGSYHSCTDAALLEQQRKELEDAAGRHVVSTRQHFLHYHSNRTPQVHAAAGIAVDSTLGFNGLIGFRAGTGFPWWNWDHSRNCSSPVLQVPLHIMDTGLFNPTSLAYDEALATTHSLEIMDRVQAAGGCLTLNWHPNLIIVPAVWNTYKTLLKAAAERDPWCGTLRDIHAHRLELEKSLVS